MLMPDRQWKRILDYSADGNNPAADDMLACVAEIRRNEHLLENERFDNDALRQQVADLTARNEAQFRLLKQATTERDATRKRAEHAEAEVARYQAALEEVSGLNVLELSHDGYDTPIRLMQDVARRALDAAPGEPLRMAPGEDAPDDWTDEDDEPGDSFDDMEDAFWQRHSRKMASRMALGEDAPDDAGANHNGEPEQGA